MRRLGVPAMPAGLPRGSKRNLRAVFVEEAPRRDIALPPPQLLNSSSVAMTTRRVPAVPFPRRANTSRPTQSLSAAPPGLGMVEKARRARANRIQMRRARAAAQDDGSAVLRHASVSPATLKNYKQAVQHFRCSTPLEPQAPASLSQSREVFLASCQSGLLLGIGSARILRMVALALSHQVRRGQPIGERPRGSLRMAQVAW